MTRYKINAFPLFGRRFKKICKKDKSIQMSVSMVLDKMLDNPFDKSLKTHKVDSKVLNDVFSSRVTGDIRVVWAFDKEEKGVIDLYDIGGHEGSNKVYN